MSPISDQELQRHLARRTTMTMPPADREDVLAAVGGARARPRFSFRMRPAPVAGTDRRDRPGRPRRRAAAVDACSRPRPVAIPGSGHDLQLPAAVGHDRRPGLGRPRRPRPGEPRSIGPTRRLALRALRCELLDVSGNSSVTIGPRDAPRGTGFQMSDGHWVVGLAIPTSPGMFAFKMAADSVEYLGPAQLATDGSPMAVPAAQSSAPSNPVDDVYVVSGWLVATSPVPCAPPPPSSPQNANLDILVRPFVADCHRAIHGQLGELLACHGRAACSIDAYDNFATNPLLDKRRAAFPTKAPISCALPVAPPDHGRLPGLPNGRPA